jgi:glycosyltransferase involved in cell wall biosynthesis
VFTHHTMYEHYLHYVPAGAGRLREFVIALVTGYCNLCDCVIAPSPSVAEILRARGVETPIEVIPTGVDVPRFAAGDGPGFRRSHGIPARACVAGYVGRLAPEKNLSFLAEAICAWLADVRCGHFLVVGAGPAAADVRRVFRRHNLGRRVHLVGTLEGQELIDAYHALDVFTFASCSETQGMVVAEAMAAGRPVVALDGPGVREVVRDGYNGRLVATDREEGFAAAVAEITTASAAQHEELRVAARHTAEQFSMDRCTRRLLAVYERLVREQPHAARDESVWRQAAEEIRAEWELLKNMAEAVGHALR